MFPIMVLTSDKHMHALRGFSYLFNKYWGDDQGVDVFGFSEPDFGLPRNFVFRSIGDFADYPLEKWSDACLKAVDMMPDHFILFLEDYWLMRPVDKVMIDLLLQFAASNALPRLLKVDLCADRLYAKDMQDFGNVGWIDLVISHKDSPYHMSLMNGIWSKNLFKQVVIPGENPWEVELNGTPRARELQMNVIGTRQWPVRHTLALRSGDHKTYHIQELNPEDQHELRKLKLLDLS